MVEFEKVPETGLLLVSDGGEVYTVMDKRELLDGMQDGTIERPKEILLAEEEQVAFSMDDVQMIIEHHAENDIVYEEWEEDMLDEIMDSPEAAAFVQYLQRISARHKIYTEGDCVKMED